MQKQMLWHSFQEKNKQLELQHKLQLEHKYQIAVLSNGVFQELREQRIMAAAEEQQQRERRDREALRRKETNCSANASSEVKQKLQVKFFSLFNLFEIKIFFFFVNRIF